MSAAGRALTPEVARRFGPATTCAVRPPSKYRASYRASRGRTRGAQLSQIFGELPRAQFFEIFEELPRGAPMVYSPPTARPVSPPRSRLGQSNSGASVPQPSPGQSNALGFSIPTGQRRERERRPEAPTQPPTTLYAQTSSRRAENVAQREPLGFLAQKDQRPRGSLLGPSFTFGSRRVRDER